MIEKFLDDLEERVDPATERELLARWKAFCDGTLDDEIFIPRRPRVALPKIAWPAVRVNEALDDYDKMALQQFRMCSDVLAGGTGGILSVRCNYGTGIVPSLFGAELFIMDDALDTLPTTRPLPGGEERFRELLAAGVPDLTTGLGARVFEMASRFLELLQPYPRLRTFVQIYHPDLQGPMDICELLYGSGLFVDLLEKPDFIKQLLELFTETYLAFMRKWRALVPWESGCSAHWAMMHRGGIMLRDDSAMNLSPQMFEEFVKPYDQRLLSELGGGAIHFCGRGDHYIEAVSQIDKLYAINMSQPECNDMETIFRNTVDKGIKLLGLNRETAEEAVRSGRDLRHCVHCR